jgi:hypothetical protein
MSRTALIVIAVILWLAGALLLTFGDGTGLKVLGAILFAAGIAAGHWECSDKTVERSDRAGEGTDADMGATGIELGTNLAARFPL